MTGRRVLAGSLFLATCLPVLLLTPFPTQDGPAHLYSASVSIHLGEAGHPLLGTFFEQSPVALSTRAVHALFSALLSAVGAFWAEKVVALLFICGLFAVFIAGLDRGGFYPLCALPLLVYSFVFRMGLYSFCLGVPLALWALLLWTSRPAVPTPRRLLAAGGCLVLLPFVHTVVAGWALMLVWTFTGVLALRTRSVSPVETAILMVASILCAFVVTHLPDAAVPYLWEAVGVRLAGLFVGGAFLGSGRYAGTWSAAASLLLLVLALLFVREEITRAGRGGDHHAFCRLCMLGVALLVAIAVPEEGAGGAYVGVRCNLLFFALLLVLLRQWQVPPRVDALLGALFLACSMAQLVDVSTALRQASTDQAEIAKTAAFLDDHTTVLAAVAGDWIDAGVPDQSTAIRPLLHAGDLLGVGGDRVVLTFYQGEIPYFPVNFKRGVSPFGALFTSGIFGWNAPAVRWDALSTWQGGVDYLAVWDEPRLLRTGPEGTGYRNVVCAHFEELYRSPTRPWVIYRLRRSGQRAAPAPPICSAVTGSRLGDG